MGWKYPFLFCQSARSIQSSRSTFSARRFISEYPPTAFGTGSGSSSSSRTSCPPVA